MGFWSSIGDAFSRDGVVTRFTEKVPGVGLITAAVQGIAGNGEHAKRALANQANALITTAGTVGGFVVGGPVGAVAGGALASSVGIAAEYGVSTTINDDKVKGDTGDTSLTRFGTDAVLGGVGGLIGGGGAGAVVKQVGGGFSKEAVKQVGGSLVKAAAKAAGGALLGQGAQGVVDTVKSGNPTQPQTDQPPKKDEPKPDLVRAVSAAQAASGLAWMRTVRKLEDFRDGAFFNCPIDNPNLSPGSSIYNITRNFSSLPGMLHENVDYAIAWAALQSYFTSVANKLTGPGSKGKNLASALLELITNQLELQAPEKDAMRTKLDEYVMAIEVQTAATRNLWLTEVHMIERTLLVPPNVGEVDF